MIRTTRKSATPPLGQGDGGDAARRCRAEGSATQTELVCSPELLTELWVSQAAAFGAERRRSAVKNELPGAANKSLTL